MPAAARPDPEAESVDGAPSAPYGGRNEIECLLAGLWIEVLGDRARPRPGADAPATPETLDVEADLYALGGLPDEAERLRLRIRDVFGQTLRPFRRNGQETVRQQAQRLEQGVGKLGTRGLVQLADGRGQVPIFCVCSIGGTVFNHRPLALALGPDRAFYGFQAVDLQRTLRREATIEDYATHYADLLEETVPSGPFAIGGHSFGAIVAFDMLRQLLERGRRPALTFLMDTAPPNQGRPSLGERAVGLFEFARGLPHLPGELRDRARRNPDLLKREVGKRLRWKAEAVRRRVLNVVAPRPQGKRGVRMSDPDLTPDDFLEMGHWPEHYKQIARRHYRAIQAYTTPTLPGPVTLFRVHRQRLSFPRSAAYGWDKYVDGPLDIVRVPGGHLSMIEPPNSAVLAERIASALEDE